MKTADSIEQQEERKAARGDKDLSPANTRHAREKLPRRDPNRIAAWKWQPGRSGNPSGRPKHDLAAEIARAVFENNHEALYKAFTKALLRGNADCYKELADRGYGRLKEHVQHEIRPYQDASDEEIRQPIAQLEQKLGYSTPEVLRRPTTRSPIKRLSERTSYPMRHAKCPRFNRLQCPECNQS